MGNKDAEREIRIAIVMYGGTSLAIYMNGIAQEFLQLVRATSRTADPSEALASTARVYRKLAHSLGGTRLEEIGDELLGTPPPVKFIIDILSGTSAGGINAVMLAKALARNADLAPLKELWLEQGALGSLINDRGSGTSRAPYRRPVRSLFNSDRMYVELLKAFERLNPADEARKPLVGSLHLAVTGTDLAGEPIDIKLADGVAREHSHKHAFRFRLGEGPTDEFTAAHDPLLAFAARATSSLPAVFEPAVAAATRTLAGRRYRDVTDWRKLFGSLQGDDADLAQRAFADGGYLDNKPFGHAIDLLAACSSSAPVSRKLYYLEPQPELLDPDAAPKGVPSALENTLQVFSLARYETIRADIQRLSERNRLIDRIRTLDAGVLEDLRAREAAAGGGPERVRPAEPSDPDLATLVIKHGPAYGGYHRLRVGTTTDALANALADHAQVPAESDVRRALRFVVRAWREDHFRRDRSGAFEPESAFLRRFDLQFHRRRARFLLAKLNELFVLDSQTADELRNVGPGSSEMADLVAGFRADEQRATGAWEEQHELLRSAKVQAQLAMLALTGPPGHVGTADAVADPTAQEGALPTRAAPGPEVRTALSGTFLGEGGELRREVRDELLSILGQPSEEASERAAERFYRARKAAVLDVAAKLEGDIARRIASAEVALSDLDTLTTPNALSAEVRELIRTYRDDYEQFDMVQFPLIEATRVGDELSPVEVHRFSPADVRHYGSAFGDDKLKGTRFASFGAFLDRRWREHDILWGRLDGAERLITTLLGNARPETRDRLITEAHLAILKEEFPADGAELRKLEAREAGGANGSAIDVARTRANTVRFLQSRTRGLELDPRDAAKDLSRVVRVMGSLSDTLSTEANLPGVVRNSLGFTSLVGSTLVDAAIPRTFWHLLSTYWSSLLLLLGAALMILGLPLRGWPGLQGALLWGVVFVAASVGFLVLRSLLWSLLAPADSRARSPGAAASRWFGRAALLLGVLLALATGAVESSVPEDAGVTGAAGMPTALALGLAQDEVDLACALRSCGFDTAAPGEVVALTLATAPGLPRARALTYLALGWVGLLAAVLAAAGLATWATPTRWNGLLGALLAVMGGAAGLWALLRIQLALERLGTGLGDGNTWLVFTSGLTKVALLLALAAGGVLVPVLMARAPSYPLSVRVLSWALGLAAAAAATLGVLGLTLSMATLLGLSITFLMAVLLGISFLFALGYFGPGPTHAPAEAGPGR